MTMLSMTGFGGGEGQAGPVTVAVELRSVNHRFLDVSLRLPGPLQIYELEIRKFLKDTLSRGRVSLAATLTVENASATATLDDVRLDQAVRMLQAAAARLEKVTGQPQPLTLRELVAVPDLFRADDSGLEPEQLKKALMDGLQAAQVALVQMKAAEGLALVTEMNQRLDTLDVLLEKVRGLAPLAAQEVKTRLETRLAEILDTQLDPQRLAQEVAMLADKANINEECERLGIHIAAYRQALVEGGQVAKRLNFLLQEMHREVNTMGSKTNLMDITQTVIAMKDEVESLREQIQKLE